METNDKPGKNASFGQFLLIFTGFVVALVGISWLILSLVK